MTAADTIARHGTITEPATLTIQRLLPGPVERVWSYLTDSDLRRKWLASGIMQMKQGSEFELTWRNDELTDPPGNKPDGFGKEHSMRCEITAIDPPRKLAFTWGRSGGVSIELEPKGERVLLTLVHRRLPDHESLLNVSGGWHAHLDVLAARLENRQPAPFWDEWIMRKKEYEARIAS